MVIQDLVDIIILINIWSHSQKLKHIQAINLVDKLEILIVK